MNTKKKKEKLIDKDKDTNLKPLFCVFEYDLY